MRLRIHHLALLLVAAILGCSRPAVRVERGPWGNWPDAVRLSNADTQVVIVPGLGRIAHYGLRDGRNLLWMHPAPFPDPEMGGIINYGGDKLWYWPQSLWNWPPPPALDEGPYRCEIDAARGEVTLVGPVDAKSKLQGRRVIRLAKSGTELTVTSRLTATAPNPAAVAPWTVTQVVEVAEVRAFTPGHLQADAPPLHPTSERGLGALQRLAPGWWSWRPDYQKKSKLFLPANIIAARVGDLWLIERMTDPAVPYEQGAQLYHGARPRDPALIYLELEFTATPRLLQASESYEITVVYSISRQSPDAR